jgi:hypothetical protein
MSNIAGKAYAMNVITPVRWYLAWINKLVFWYASRTAGSLGGLATLSLIHYARWVIIDRSKFPRLDASQPKEKLHYAYMLFFSNFNGSWDQYVDSFSFAIPRGLDFFWLKNVRYPKSVPITPFHDYISHNQIATDHYYNAYPLASSNDVKSAKHLKQALISFVEAMRDAGTDEFVKKYHALLVEVQNDLGDLQPTPIVSLASQAVQARRLQDAQPRP